MMASPGRQHHADGTHEHITPSSVVDSLHVVLLTVRSTERRFDLCAVSGMRQPVSKGSRLLAGLCDQRLHTAPKLNHAWPHGTGQLKRQLTTHAAASYVCSNSTHPHGGLSGIATQRSCFRLASPVCVPAPQPPGSCAPRCAAAGKQHWGAMVTPRQMLGRTAQPHSTAGSTGLAHRVPTRPTRHPSSSPLGRVLQACSQHKAEAAGVQLTRGSSAGSASISLPSRPTISSRAAHR